MRKLLSLLTFALVVLSIAPSAMAEAQPAGVVNINTASVAELSLLPRIGEKAAQRIIDFRTKNGAFKTTAQLTEVKGVGEKTFELLSRHVTVDGKTTLTAKVATPRKTRTNKPTTTASN